MGSIKKQRYLKVITCHVPSGFDQELLALVVVLPIRQLSSKDFIVIPNAEAPPHESIPATKASQHL